MSRKIKIRRKNMAYGVSALRANAFGWYPDDHNRLQQIHKFLNENDISHRTAHFWSPKTRKGMTGAKYLGHIIFYNDCDVNLFKLKFNDEYELSEM